MNKRILIYFPTNIGDTIIGLPVLDAMQANYPAHSITAIASRHTQEFLRRNTFINKVLLFDKAWPVSKKIKFSFSLWGKYDIFVDLKNSFLPVIAGSLKRTPFYRKQTNNVLAKDAYLRIVARLARFPAKEKSDFSLNDAERKRWEKLKLSGSIFVACSSRSSQKSYPRNLLKTVIDALSQKYRIAILGEERDREHYGDMVTGDNVVDLTGKTTLYDVAYLLRHYARLLLCVDSSILQLGSY
ncbi:MAG: glycosyltransferase family 9 protein, partial [Candidatus Omnitrophica bacterium]|nr:glycosyltransferase family 9 protein [Candidatus Omnitrophota bacterium]